MKKQLSLFILHLLFVFIVSCNGQNKTDLPTDNKSQPQSTENDLPNHDPYFVETSYMTSSYGPTSITRNIMQDKNGNIWLATWEGIIRYDGQTFTNFTNKEEVRRFHVFAVLEDTKGNLWFGTIGAGVYRYDGKTFTNFTIRDGLANDWIGCIYEDKKGIIWIGTEGGISCFDGKSFRNFTTKDGLCNNDINSIIEDQTGKFWIGARGNACYYDGTTFSEISRITGEPFVNVRSIVKDKKGNIWLGGNDGLWRYDGMFFTQLSKDFTGYIYEDRAGNLWTSSVSPTNRDKWMLSRNDEKSLSSEKLTATKILEQEGMFFGIVEDDNGGIWLGTLGGVGRYDGQTFNWFKE
ncbi:MAG: two-component regulator propeller domain-containing protein [Saprospiraceae bacterium]